MRALIFCVCFAVFLLQASSHGIYAMRDSDDLHDMPLGLATPAPALAVTSVQQVVVTDHGGDFVIVNVVCVVYVYDAIRWCLNSIDSY